MSTQYQYVGEIRLVGFNFAPADWFLCDGQLLPISEFEVLFNLIGTIYGGDGQTTFALPNLQSRVAIHQGSDGESTYVIGQLGGVENVTITDAELPSHSHTINAVTANGNSPTPAGAVFAASSAGQYVPVASATGAMANIVSAAGGSQPHSNIQPYLAMTYIIAWAGVYPSQG
jgi:microcystin-dependent protein